MLKVTVLYGHPQDPAAFDHYYAEVHTPLALTMPGLKGFTVGKAATTNPNEPSPYYLIANLYVDSLEAFQATMASPAGQATVADLHNFASGGVTILLSEELVLIPVSLTK
ncbi:MAG TPA: EthD family reductase [Ktedonobacteraceae bacterium]|nr:EthD family reductase [Ktedonobacteraceae bacterium]